MSCLLNQHLTTIDDPFIKQQLLKHMRQQTLESIARKFVKINFVSDYLPTFTFEVDTTKSVEDLIVLLESKRIVSTKVSNR